jgi:hypothetical protein
VPATELVRFNDTRHLVNTSLPNAVVSSFSNVASHTPQSPLSFTPDTYSIPHVPPPKRTRSTFTHYTHGELGKLAQRNEMELAWLGWHRYFYHHRHPSSITPSIHKLPHPTVQYLTRLASTGAPAVSTTRPWTLHEKDLAYSRGPHVSAAIHHADFLMADLFEYVAMGYWTVLPYAAVRSFPALRLSPAGVVPQRERCPRPIMDYSFYGINQSFLPLASPHAMQFGQTLPCLLQRLVYCNPTYGPPLLAKVDLSDGYYRVPLSASAALHLAVLIPSDISSAPLVALPLSLPMGWNHSPPYFCAFTESVADVANSSSCPSHPHPLYPSTQLASTQTHSQFHLSAIVLGSDDTPPLNYTDVYLDDFLLAAQPPQHVPTMHRLLHALDAVFSDPPDTPRRPLISPKKTGPRRHHL